MQLAGGVGVEPGHGLLGRRAGAVQLRGDGLLLGDDASQLVEAPLVGLVQVDGRAEEEAREALVPLAADAVGLAGPVREPAQALGQAAVGGGGLLGVRGQLAAQPLGCRLGGGELREERALAGELLGLRDADPDLPLRRERQLRALRRVADGLQVAVDCGRHRPEAGGDGGPVVLGGGGHQVEDHPDRLDGRRDVVDLGVVLAGLVQLQLKA